MSTKQLAIVVISIVVFSATMAITLMWNDNVKEHERSQQMFSCVENGGQWVVSKDNETEHECVRPSK